MTVGDKRQSGCVWVAGDSFICLRGKMLQWGIATGLIQAIPHSGRQGGALGVKVGRPHDGGVSLAVADVPGR